MTVVVSDTSPIRALDFLRRLETLPILFGNILLPPAVVDELARTSNRFRPIFVTDCDYLQMRAVSDTRKVNSLLPTIDRGEAEAIVLAREVGADAILIDEADAALERCIKHCLDCGIRFLAAPQNAGLDDLRCPFGCAKRHRARRSNERVKAYRRTKGGKRKKDALNARR